MVFAQFEQESPVQVLRIIAVTSHFRQVEYNDSIHRIYRCIESRTQFMIPATSEPNKLFRLTREKASWQHSTLNIYVISGWLPRQEVLLEPPSNSA